MFQLVTEYEELQQMFLVAYNSGKDSLKNSALCAQFCQLVYDQIERHNISFMITITEEYFDGNHA